MQLKTKYLLLFSLLFSSITPCLADSDSLFLAARKYVEKKQYDSAEMVLKMAISESPNYADLRYYLGVIYSWNGRYNESRIQLKKALAIDSTNKEYLVSYINMENWAGNPEEVILSCNSSLIYYPNDEWFIYQKAKANYEMGMLGEAIKLLNELRTINPDNADALSLRKKIYIENSKDKVGFQYTIENYKKMDPRHLLAFSYTNATKYGSIIGRINTARKFQSNGIQAEIDAYPSLSANSYAYVNVGYSPSSIFPSFRAGFDYNRSLPKSFEMSAGIRFLKFTSSDVYIFTGHLGKYYGNYWFSARPYITPSSTGTSVSGQLIARRYLSTAEHYLSLQIGYGTSPDDRMLNLNPDLPASESRLKAKRIKLEYTQTIFKYWNYNIGVAYENEEWRTNTFRDVITLGFGLSRML